MSEHTLVIKHYGVDGEQYELECSDPENCDDVYDEGDWPDDVTCRCQESECECRIGEHDACYEYGYWISDLGPACRCVPWKGCGMQDWLHEAGIELLAEWKEPVIVRVPVKVLWEVDYPILVPR